MMSQTNRSTGNKSTRSDSSFLVRDISMENKLLDSIQNGKTAAGSVGKNYSFL